MRILLSLVALTLAAPAFAADPPKLKLLFLGDSAGHKPAERFKIIQPVFAARGIDLTYTDTLDDLNPKTLTQYDGLLIYANHTKITPEQEKALLDYVASGKGFIPVHCASYCFLNSPAYTELVGAQFRSHGTGTFRTDVVMHDHPIMKGYQPFTSWDETYVHTKHNEKDRSVLEVRTDGDLKEPWTWVRTPGKSRVFYTAWGHDQRTWGNPGFQNLLERGVRWACGQDPALAGSAPTEKPRMTTLPKGLKPFEYVPAKVPFYPPRRGEKADPITKMQKPLDPEESRKHYVTPVDFEVRTFVTEKELGGKPIAMTWDEQGRLFVAVTQDYPNEKQPEGEGRDRILCCEDVDGDGVCDKVTVFADKLSIPTSLLPYAGGLIVTQAPHTLFLKDTTGSGKADLRQVLFTGWSTGDTHAGPSNLRYGFDNWVYGSVGYAGFRGEVGGETVTMRQGFYRFKVEPNNEPPGLSRRSPLKVTKLEFLRSTSNNTWGLNFSEDGQLFGSTANGCPLVHLPIPNRYYEKVKGLTPTVLPNIAADNHFEPITDKVRQVDWHGGFTAASHVALYTARTYPKEYWNRTAFVSDPTGHLTAAFVLEPDGATYKAKYGWNLLASDDEWASPIDAQVGPDGHMWVIDWYAYIVQHNPTPAGFKTGKGNAYETELRDKTHGRIYRVVYTKAKPEPRPNLKGATPEKLVETLKHHNLTWRLHAQRLLVERGNKDVGPALVKLLADKSADVTGLNAGAVHAAYVLTELGAAKESTKPLIAASEHPSAAVRRAVYQVIPKDTDLLGIHFFHWEVDERNTQARLALYLTTPEIPNTRDNMMFDQIGRRILDSAGDRIERDALLIAAAAQPRIAMSGAVLSEVKPSPEGLADLERLARYYAAAGGDELLSVLLDFLILDATRTDVAAAVVNGLAAGWPAGMAAKGTVYDAEIKGMLKKLPVASRGRFLKLAATWGVKGLDAQLAELTKGLFATVANASAPDAERVEAAKQVVEFQPESDEAAARLLDAVGPGASPALAAGIFEALAASKSKGVGAAVVAKVKDLPPAARPAAMRLVLSKPDATRAFLDAVEKGTLRFDLLALDQKQALASHPDKALAERAKKLLALGGGLPNADRQKVIDELKHVIEKEGDPANGKKLFVQHCGKCHKHGSEGTANIGPDLSGMAVHPKEELLIAILDPSRSVEGNYKAYRVTTADGRTLTGLLASESKTAVEVVDADGKRFPLSRDDIESIKETDKSLMPEGFEKQMKPAELGDLLEFLTQKGKYVPLPLDKVATVVTTKDMFFDAGGQAERLIFPDWSPKTFKGVPFVLVDPRGEAVKNAVMLYGPQGKVPPTMPRAVTVPFNGKAAAVHLLSGVGGWNAAAAGNTGRVSMTVRLHYADGSTEDHALRDGVHFADYIRRVDVPGSEFAFDLRGRQIRYLAVTPKKPDAVLKGIEFVKGPDRSAPVVMAVTVESP